MVDDDINHEGLRLLLHQEGVSFQAEFRCSVPDITDQRRWLVTREILALTELGSIDQYEFVVRRRIAGDGPTLRGRNLPTST